MKNVILCLLLTLICIANKLGAQNMAVNGTGALPDASAMVDIASTTRGFLAPRMTTTQQNLIASPATGLLIYNLTTNTFMVNTGTPAIPAWTPLSSSSSSSTNWLLTGNAATNSATNFLGTTDAVKLAFRTSNLQRMLIDELGRVGVGVTNPTNPLVVKDTFEIRRTGTVSQLLFSNTSGTGDFRIAGDGGDIFWQGGGGRNLQMSSYWQMILGGDRQTGTPPAFSTGVANTGVLVLGQRDGSVPLAIQGNSASQSANLTEWRNSAGTVLDVVTKNGDVGIGTSIFNTTFPEKLLVDAGVTNSVTAIAGKGNINSYLQLNIQNNSTGANSSSDVVATANNGDENTNYVDMGINGQNNNSNIMGTGNDAYLYNVGQNFFIGTGSTGKSLMFLTGGTDSASNERMRIDGNGNVGIGVANPAYKLQVSATANPLQLTGLQAGASSDSILTITTAGVVRRVTYSVFGGVATPSTNAWSLTGTAATATNFLGTTNTQPLIIKQNSIQVARFDANSMAIGVSSITNNATHSYAFGSSATIAYNLKAAMALGNNASITADSSFALGTAAITRGQNSMSIGNDANSNGPNSLAIGRAAYTHYNNADAVAIGTNATANAANSIAIGGSTATASKTISNGSSSIAFGNGAQSNNTSALAFGNGALSNSINAIAIGTTASTGYNLTNPLAIGYGAVVNGNSGTAIGNGANVATVANATVLGAGASATGTANNSTAVGYNTDVTKADEVILGDMTNTNISVGIGSENFSTSNREKLLVDMGNTTSVNAIAGKGNINSYLQLNIQNNSAGANASSDVVATANNGDEVSNYIDMGINGQYYTGGIMGNANDGYMYTLGNNFLIGTANTGKSLIFMTGGTYQPSNERMRIDGNGNVGIGNTNPNSTLSVTGSQSVSFRTGTGSYTVLATDYAIINTGGGSPTWTLPAANSCAGRVYMLINHGTSSIFITPSVITQSGTAGNTLGTAAGSNTVLIISDGANWRKMN
ncbi:MAG: hypothetical protein ABIX01_08560, partial [Chitinophagaceae bacterium]